MKRRLEVGQVWEAKTDTRPEEFANTYWVFEIVAKVSTPEGIRVIAAKHDGGALDRMQLEVFNEDGSPSVHENFMSFYLTKKLKRAPIYRAAAFAMN